MRRYVKIRWLLLDLSNGKSPSRSKAVKEILAIVLVGLLAFPGAYSVTIIANGGAELERAMVEEMQEEARQKDLELYLSIKPEHRWQQ